MVHIKSMVMQGFKSFARRTEIPFDQGINVILGPNGAGKSNVSDALCFVLGRLSIKSMRAAKARNLLFMGTKYIKPAKEAWVEIVFDNTDKGFAIDSPEVRLKRIVRYNGQGVYKINNETKTRLEVIEMLAQAGIDPYGFNLILQGQIQSIVKMHPDDRRKIIEEVAGISIYESRKEKSLRELEKTDEKLKEITLILRDRTAYLKNLDKERTEALRFKDLELTLRRCSASLLTKRIHEKEKELSSIGESIGEKAGQKESLRATVEKLQKELEDQNEAINRITKHIQQATGLEQETLHTAIANLRAEIEGLKVRCENYENRAVEVGRRITEMQKAIPDFERDIKGLKEESPLMAQKAEELKRKKEELAAIEEERKQAQAFKAELGALRERLRDKERQLSRAVATSEALVKHIEEYEGSIIHTDERACTQALVQLRRELGAAKKNIEALAGETLLQEKRISAEESSIRLAEENKQHLEKIDICPLCQSKITNEHISHVFADADKTITSAHNNISEARGLIDSNEGRRNALLAALESAEKKISSAEIELITHRAMKEKHEQLKKLVEEERLIRDEMTVLEQRRKRLEEKTIDISKFEERYDTIILEIEEISSRTSEDINTALLYKERELENMHNVIKRGTKDRNEIELQLKELQETLHEKQHLLAERESQELALQKRFKQLFDEREKIQKSIQENNFKLSETQNEIRAIEDQINYLKIGKAKLDAEREALQMSLTEFAGIELIQGSVAMLEERLKKAQESLQHIGSINMRALEVYEEVKKEYDVVQEKVMTLEKEKQEILSIIAEIDQKKKRSFIKTFKAMNALFSENFSRLSSKGIAYLELDNPEDIFSGGVNIVVKLAKGKYFDVTSLSGGEQTLVALSLLFAIQEYKPYHFYVFDEIDAALDKRNSERLAALLNQYMKSGQYVVITHNDAIIMKSNVLYGVSMHDGVSKILSLKVQGEIRETAVENPAEPVALTGDMQNLADSSEMSDEVMPLDEDFTSPEKTRPPAGDSIIPENELSEEE